MPAAVQSDRSVETPLPPPDEGTAEVFSLDVQKDA